MKVLVISAAYPPDACWGGHEYLSPVSATGGARCWCVCADFSGKCWYWWSSNSCVHAIMQEIGDGVICCEYAPSSRGMLPIPCFLCTLVLCINFIRWWHFSLRSAKGCFRRCLLWRATRVPSSAQILPRQDCFRPSETSRSMCRSADAA